VSEGLIDPSHRSRVALGVAVPLGVLVLAYALWHYSDLVGYVGPLDKASFGWVVVAPVWLLAPLAAGWTWRELTPPASALAKVIVGAIVTTVATVLFWIAVTEPACEFGPRTPSTGWMAPSILIGLLVGSGLVAGGSFAAHEIRDGRGGRRSCSESPRKRASLSWRRGSSRGP